MPKVTQLESDRIWTPQLDRPGSKACVLSHLCSQGAWSSQSFPNSRITPSAQVNVPSSPYLASILPAVIQTDQTPQIKHETLTHQKPQVPKERDQLSPLFSTGKLLKFPNLCKRGPFSFPLGVSPSSHQQQQPELNSPF